MSLKENGIFQKAKQASDAYQTASEQEQENIDRIYVENEGAYLPKGFKYLKGTKKSGLVIQNRKTQDEFVWVPVTTPVLDLSNDSTLDDNKIKQAVKEEIAIGEYPMAIKQSDGNYIGVLYQFSLDNEKQQVKIEPLSDWKPTSSDSGYREPDTVTEYKEQYKDLANITKENLQKEYKELVESVINNGGFYIGRYESGFSGDKAVSKANETNISNKTWYDMYTKQKNIYDDNSGVKTHMIWGSQWDQVMIYLKDVPNENATEKKFFILDGRGMGNYNNTQVVPTGTNSDYAVKEIYGLAGNVYDWVMVVQDNNKFGLRGGYCQGQGTSEGPVNYRLVGGDVGAWFVFGSRLTLYK